ncbi:MAG: hypothetical protein E7307_04285 [Butyrivibrio sp.]|nr:hypothetical protein [Butyrivibrio sp.]
MNNDKIEKELLGEDTLNTVHGGLDLTLGLPNATKDDRVVKNTLQTGKKKKASNLLFKEESVVDMNPRKC